MMLGIKPLLASGAAALVVIAGLTWYAKHLNGKLEDAQTKLGSVETALDIATTQSELRQRENERLGEVLQQRRQRELEARQTSIELQERIDALTGECVLSDDAHSLLWDFYESASGTRRVPDTEAAAD